MTRPACDSPTCPHDRRGWHLNKGLDLGHLLVTVSMLAGFILWALAQERRITTVENGLRSEHEINRAQDLERARQRDEIRSDLKAINEKLDRLVERR